MWHDSHGYMNKFRSPQLANQQQTMLRKVPKSKLPNQQLLLIKTFYLLAGAEMTQRQLHDKAHCNMGWPINAESMALSAQLSGSSTHQTVSSQAAPLGWSSSGQLGSLLLLPCYSGLLWLSQVAGLA